ncbi:hypothetical protein BS78_08G147200 [Paspalum vaginatum]|nr:hypothetical protein BS78_08G147200 [Paspalum vaginatum]
MFISAYSLEDNELWKRHAVTLVSQVTVALYVFCKWWSGETRLLQAAVLIFVVGIIRFSEKPWALRRASLGTLLASASSTNLLLLLPRDKDEGGRARRFCSALFCECANIFEVADRDDAEERDFPRYSLQQYVERAQKQALKQQTEQSRELLKEENKEMPLKHIYSMFLDLSAPYSTRLHYLQLFLKIKEGDEHLVIGRWIRAQFIMMYTRIRSACTCLGLCTLLLIPCLALASVVLLAKSSKDGYNKSDVTVTYILFSVTAVMDLLPFCFHFLLHCSRVAEYSWEDMVSQHNIMLFCARKKKPSVLMKLAAAFSSCLSEYINKHWYIWHEPAAQQVSLLVRRHARDGWKKYISDSATYTRFSNLRGELALSKHQPLLERLGWTFVDVQFDELVLLWHVATELLLHHTTAAAAAALSQGGGDAVTSRRNSEIISNYMIYLLFVRPEMLMLGATEGLFMLACDQIELMIKKQDDDDNDDDQPRSSLMGERIRLAQRILGTEMDDHLTAKAPMICSAHKIAKELIGHIKDDDERWEVIQGVWVEMLCYSASRCRGYEHAKNLGHGGPPERFHPADEEQTPAADLV